MTHYDDEVAIAAAIAAEAITDATRAGIGFGIQVVDAYARHFPEAAEHCDIIAATMRIKSISFEIKPQPSIDQPSVAQEPRTAVGAWTGRQNRQNANQTPKRATPPPSAAPPATTTSATYHTTR
jgi:hypothetical protein